MKPAKHQY